MDYKLLILFAIFLLTNAGNLNPNDNNTGRLKSIRTLPDNNRGTIRIKNASSFMIVVQDPVATFKPRSVPTYLKTSTLPSTSVENYHSQGYETPNYELQNYESQNYQPQDYQPEKYELPNFQSQNYESQIYQPQNYQLRDYQLQNDYSFGNPSSEINYASEPIVQSERFNSMKKVKSIIYSNKPQQSEIVNSGAYGPVFSKSGYATVPTASSNSLNLNPNDYVEPTYKSDSLSSRSLSNFNTITEKPLVKIAYSPASEVSHVTFKSANGQVYYTW